MTSSNNLTNDEILKEENKKLKYYNESGEDVIIEQFVQGIIDVSSQYGSDFSISYTAYNLTGKPSKYPEYGDFPETYAMRSYGKWWDMVLSKEEEIMPQNTPDIPIHDFIIIKFEEYVVPTEVNIYETYNPGAAIRIWAFTISEKWVKLWQGKPSMHPKRSNIFSPPINKIDDLTNIIKIEFNHSYLDYFTEIDAIMLVGKKVTLIPNNKSLNNKVKKGPILRKLEGIKFTTQIFKNQEDIIDNFFKNDLNKFEKAIDVEHDNNDDQLTLKDLPYEILFKICSYLDLESLFRVGRVCRNLHNVSNDPLLYMEISLKPYWHLANSELIKTITKRAIFIKKFDLSWCGFFNSITSNDFCDFIKENGKNLTHLRLGSCKFLTNCCVNLIGSLCTNLTELSLRNIILSDINIGSLSKLQNLERLDLFRTDTETQYILWVLKSNSKLKHLNLGFCGISVDMDEIATTISIHNTNLISLDMWKSHSLTSVGLLAMAKCQHLEEVDFGWCLREEALPGESLKMLLKGCPKLKKLFLAAIRGLTDRDLDNIATYCPNLEQLDLMGIMTITTEMCYKILQKCTKLKLFDLSFCDQIDDFQVKLWREIYDTSIKRSNVTTDFLF